MNTKIADAASVLLVMAMAAPLALTGCGGHDFIMEAPAAIARGAVELEMGVEEYHVAAVEELDRAAAQQRDALKADLAAYIVKTVNADLEPGTVTAEDAMERLETNFSLYEKQTASLETERAAERERYATMKGLCAWIRKVAAQVVEIETREYATLEQLRDLASEQVRTRVEEGRHE